MDKIDLSLKKFILKNLKSNDEDLKDKMKIISKMLENGTTLDDMCNHIYINACAVAEKTNRDVKEILDSHFCINYAWEYYQFMLNKHEDEHDYYECNKFNK